MINDVLSKIQTSLKATKGQFNKFGGFSYRSAEDILDAVKPLLEENNATITICNEVLMFGERFYVKSTARFAVGEESIEVTAFAREPDAQKGMSPSQVTGSATSYANKYCLGNLLILDDNSDPDSRDNREESGPKKPNPKKPSSFKKKVEPKVEAKVETETPEESDGWS